MAAMTGESALGQWFAGYTDRFRDRAGRLHPLLELKHSHSLRVAENARLIAADLGLPERERRFAADLGLLHDVGRFTQFARYGSFRDADTLDHGAEGRRVLEGEAPPLPPDPEGRERLLIAVACHNRRQADLPAGLSDSQSRFLSLIRDADKLDIMDLVLRAVAADGFRDLTAMLPHLRLDRALSPAALAEAAQTRSVSSGNLSTLADLLLMLATWFFDMNYAPTRRLALERAIPDRLRRALPDHPAVRELFAAVAAAMGEATGKIDVIRGKAPFPERRRNRSAPEASPTRREQKA